MVTDLVNGNNCTLLQIGLNSPLTPDPENRPPLNLTVVVDVSGSMQAAGKIDFACGWGCLGCWQRALRRRPHGAGDLQRRGRGAGGDDGRGCEPQRLGRRHRAPEPRRRDGIHDGLEVGYQESLRNYDSGRQNRVILLERRRADGGQYQRRVYPSDEPRVQLRWGGPDERGAGVRLNIGLMRGLAEQADGNFYFVEDAGAVDEVFTEELSYFTVPVAFDLEVTMTTGEDYGLRAIGSHFWETTEAGGRL